MNHKYKNISAELSFEDYPQKVFEELYRGCAYCGTNVNKINDQLVNHSPSCEYRLKQEADLIVGAEEDDLILKLHNIFQNYSEKMALEKALMVFAAIAVNCGYLKLSSYFFEKVKLLDTD